MRANAVRSLRRLGVGEAPVRRPHPVAPAAGPSWAGPDRARYCSGLGRHGRMPRHQPTRPAQDPPQGDRQDRGASGQRCGRGRRDRLGDLPDGSVRLRPSGQSRRHRTGRTAHRRDSCARCAGGFWPGTRTVRLHFLTVRLGTAGSTVTPTSTARRPPPGRRPDGASLRRRQWQRLVPITP